MCIRPWRQLAMHGDEIPFATCVPLIKDNPKAPQEKENNIDQLGPCSCPGIHPISNPDSNPNAKPNAKPNAQPKPNPPSLPPSLSLSRPPPSSLSLSLSLSNCRDGGRPAHTRGTPEQTRARARAHVVSKQVLIVLATNFLNVTCQDASP